MEEVIKFLEANGFKTDGKKTETGNIVWESELCIVCIDGDRNFMGISKGRGEVFEYSNYIGLYWLIGVLTYNGLISKNYKNAK